MSRAAFHPHKCIPSLSSGFLNSLRSQKRKNKSCCEYVCVCVRGLSISIEDTRKEVRGHET